MIQSFGYKLNARYLSFVAGVFAFLPSVAFAAEDIAEAPSDAAYGAGEGEYDGHGADYAEVDGLPQLDFSTYSPQIFWLIVIFGLMYFFFSKKSLPDLSSTIENRKNHIDADLSSAEKLQAEAEEVQQQYEAGLSEARSNAADTISEIDKSIKAKIADDLDAFQKRSEKEIQDIETRIEQAKSEAMDNMNDIATEVAADAVQKIIGVNPDAQKAKSIVESLNGKAEAA
ncbi:MAG: hypothetical protein AAF569_07890 [Pseudomonadota bacterium]